MEEKFSAPQAQKDFKPEKFAEGMSLSLQSASLRLERNFTLCGLCDLCARHPMRFRCEPGFERDTYRFKRPMEYQPHCTEIHPNLDSIGAKVNAILKF